MAPQEVQNYSKVILSHGEEEGGGRDGGVPDSQASSNILCSFVFVGRLVVGGVIRVPGKWFVFLKHAFSWERHSQLNKSDWLTAKTKKTKS